MKTISLLLLCLTFSAFSFAQTSVSFDGDYERRGWRNKESPRPDSDLSIKGMAGSFQDFAPKMARTNNCAGKTAPLEVSKMDGDKITFTVKLSSIMAHCQDFTATFQHITVNGKSGLALPNSNEVMFVKK